MHIKSQWAKSIACAYLIICAVAGGVGIQSIVTDVGPHVEYYVAGTGTVAHDIAISSDTTEIGEIQSVLNKYTLRESVKIKAGVFDCSDVSELIWYVMTNEGYLCYLVSNDATWKCDGKLVAHMFTWVILDDGVVTIESTGGNDPHNQIGKVINVTETDTFYTHGWVSESPTQLMVGKYKNEMMGITADYPIEMLPLVQQETTLEKLCREQKTRWG